MGGARVYSISVPLWRNLLDAHFAIDTNVAGDQVFGAGQYSKLCAVLARNRHHFADALLIGAGDDHQRDGICSEDARQSGGSAEHKVAGYRVADATLLFADQG